MSIQVKPQALEDVMQQGRTLYDISHRKVTTADDVELYQLAEEGKLYTDELLVAEDYVKMHTLYQQIEKAQEKLDLLSAKFLQDAEIATIASGELSYTVDVDTYCITATKTFAPSIPKEDGYKAFGLSGDSGLVFSETVYSPAPQLKEISKAMHNNTCIFMDEEALLQVVEHTIGTRFTSFDACVKSLGKTDKTRLKRLNDVYGLSDSDSQDIVKIMRGYEYGKLVTTYRKILSADMFDELLDILHITANTKVKYTRRVLNG